MKWLSHSAVLGTLGLMLGGLNLGCADRPMAVPATATLMNEGQGNLTFRATEFGRVYVSDQTRDRILY